MRIWNSLQAKLFITYSFIFIAIMLTVSIPMYIYLKNNIEKSTISRVNETLSKIKDRLDDRMYQFDVLSNLLYFQTNISGQPAVNYLYNLSLDKGFYEKYQSRVELVSFVAMLSVIDPDAYNIRIFTENGALISGKQNDATNIMPLNTYSSFESVLKTNGEIILKYEPEDPWSVLDHTPVFTMSRMLLPWQSRSGILEVQVEAQNILTSDMLQQNKGADFTFYYNGGRIYSTQQDEDSGMGITSSTYEDLRRQAEANKGRYHALIGTGSGKEYVFYQSTNRSGLEVIRAVPEQVIFAPLNFFRNVALSTIALLILFSVTVFYIMARILTQPLKVLKKSIDMIGLDDKLPNVDNKYRMDEINLINRSFRNMNDRLQHSLEETVRFRTLQLQANFDMLQAQINPHFLFNMLGFIQSSAEDRDMEQVHALSRNLLGFFRYSISTKSPVITLEKEVEFTGQYLELMQTRFMHRLSYQLDIDPALLHIVVPKLTLQPFVENSIHYGFSDRIPTMNITVRAFIEGESWEIQIKDTGAGFSAMAMSTVKENVDGYLDRMYSSADGERLSLGGMGVASTISRLKFMFREQFTYEIGNTKQGGASIRLRGPMRR